jgi:hypothetical protein
LPKSNYSIQASSRKSRASLFNGTDNTIPHQVKNLAQVSGKSLNQNHSMKEILPAERLGYAPQNKNFSNPRASLNVKKLTSSPI